MEPTEEQKAELAVWRWMNDNVDEVAALVRQRMAVNDLVEACVMMLRETACDIAAAKGVAAQALAAGVTPATIRAELAEMRDPVLSQAVELVLRDWEELRGDPSRN